MTTVSRHSVERACRSPPPLLLLLLLSLLTVSASTALAPALAPVRSRRRCASHCEPAYERGAGRRRVEVVPVRPKAGAEKVSAVAVYGLICSLDWIQPLRPSKPPTTTYTLP